MFEDDTTTKKPKVKPSAVVPVIPAAPIEAAVAASAAAASVAAAELAAEAVIPAKKAPVQQNKITRRKVVPLKSIAPPALEKNTLNFQHTPALLELSQSSIKKPTTEDSIIIGLEPGQRVPEKVVVIQVPESTNHDEETAVNQVTEQLMENNEIPSEKVTIEQVPQQFNDLNSDETEDDDNMIIISSSSDIKDANIVSESNVEKDVQEDEISESDDAVEEEDDSVESDKVQDTIVEPIEVSTVAVIKKKPVKKEDEGLLSTIVGLIEDDEDVKDDGTKDEAVATEDTTSEEEEEEDEDEKDDSTEKDETEKDEDDDEDDEEDDDEDDDDTDKKKDKVTATETKKPEKGNKTKKKDEISFASIGETLGLSRIFRAKAE